MKYKNGLVPDADIIKRESLIMKQISDALKTIRDLEWPDDVEGEVTMRGHANQDGTHRVGSITIEWPGAGVWKVTHEREEDAHDE